MNWLLILAVLAAPAWLVGRFGHGQKGLLILIATILLFSLLGFLMALCSSSGTEEFAHSYLGPPIGCGIVGYVFSTVPLLLWLAIRYHCQRNHLRHLILQARKWPERKLADRDPNAERLERSLDHLDDRMEVRYVSCAVAAEDGELAFEDWAEVAEEESVAPAYLLLPARAWLRRKRCGESEAPILEPWNPFDAVLIGPGRASDAKPAIVAASKSRFCADVTFVLESASQSDQTKTYSGSRRGPVGVSTT